MRRMTKNLIQPLCCVLLLLGGPLRAETGGAWALRDALELARTQRQDIQAATAKAEAARERPAIVSALEDPVLAPAIDHYPFDKMKNDGGMGAPAPSDDGMDDDGMSDPPTAEPATTDTNNRRYDWSVSLEQSFPLSRVRQYKADAARADADIAVANVSKKVLDIELETVMAFYMLNEKRRMASVIDEQISLTQQLATAANARYSAGSGSQTDVLRVEVELARLAAQKRANAADIRAAEAMLNGALGREATLPVPPLKTPPLDLPLPSQAEAMQAAASKRPELHIGSAELSRAVAEVKSMRSMYSPMGMVRVGYASTMAEGKGAMLMLGVSLPIWREKLSSGVNEARAMRRMANADLAAMKRMIEAETLSAHQALEAAQIQYLSLRDDVVPRAERLVSPALSSYSSGQGSVAAVIDAAQAQWAIKGEAIMAESALGIAWARLYRMTGTHVDHAL